MNERIKELLKQSKLHSYDYAQEAQIDMFAGLIVKECIDAVSAAGGDNTYYHIDAIKLHFEDHFGFNYFGIEE